MTDAYAALAEIYDEWQERHGAFWRLALPRLEESLARFGPPQIAPGLLDLGCGTGELLLAFAEAHPEWTLAGVDASGAMLHAARRKRGADRVQWVQGGFDDGLERQLDRERFAAAGSFFDALNHAVGPGALARAFLACASALAPGGLFAFDLNNRVGFDAWWNGSRVYPGAGWTLTMTASFDPVSGLAHGRAVVDRLGPFGGQTITDVIERCFPDDEVRATLEDAGFTVLTAEPWAPLPRGLPGKTWWVARRH